MGKIIDLKKHRDDLGILLSPYRALSDHAEQAFEDLLPDLDRAGKQVARDAILREYASIETGRLVASMRKFAGISQSKLAALIGTTQPAIARIENGESVQGPTIATLLRISDTCGFDLKIIPEVRIVPPLKEGKSALLEHFDPNSKRKSK